eukprot:54642-Eustigmatos_ZCMA.PRE.1
MAYVVLSTPQHPTIVFEAQQMPANQLAYKDVGSRSSWRRASLYASSQVGPHFFLKPQATVDQEAMSHGWSNAACVYKWPFHFFRGFVSVRDAAGIHHHALL